MEESKEKKIIWICTVSNKSTTAPTLIQLCSLDSDNIQFLKIVFTYWAHSMPWTSTYIIQFI